MGETVSVHALRNGVTLLFSVFYKDIIYDFSRESSNTRGLISAQRLQFPQVLHRRHGNCSLCADIRPRSEEHTSELQSHLNLVCRLLLEKKKDTSYQSYSKDLRDGSRITSWLKRQMTSLRNSITPLSSIHTESLCRCMLQVSSLWTYVTA